MNVGTVGGGRADETEELRVKKIVCSRGVFYLCESAFLCLSMSVCQ